MCQAFRWEWPGKRRYRGGGGGSRGNERGDKQNLRYERNAKFNADDVKAKLADPCGIALVV